MNKRQKIVQQRFLNNERAILDSLKQIYSQALTDIDDKIALLLSKSDDMTQSIVYQVEYQKALKTQISGILDDLNGKQFSSVAEYLSQCYEDGFVGTMFDLQGQGIPLIFPIDQEAVVRAVQLDSKISQGLYTRMGEDVKTLKKNITAEISRGIANGSRYDEIARQISHKMTGSYNTDGGALGRAMTIARTEGHRIQVQGGFDACYKAKEKGADVLKQWDSTMDRSTRPSHQKVDGEIRELDETFSNGLLYPSDPSGSAKEVVNCRCALLQRARWALDEVELKTLQNRAEYFGLDKADNFEEYKKKYLQASEQINIENKRADFEKQLKNAKTTGEINTLATQYFTNKKNCKIQSIDFSDTDLQASKDMVLKLDDLDNKYHSSLTKFSTVDDMAEDIGGQCKVSQSSFSKYLDTENLQDLQSEIALNNKFLKNKKVIAEDFVSQHKSKGDIPSLVSVDEENKNIVSLVHEYGHSILPSAVELNINTGGSEPTFENISALYKKYMKDVTDDTCVSQYSKYSVGEFIAECFCDAELNSKPKAVSVEVHKLLTKNFGKGG